MQPLNPSQLRRNVTGLGRSVFGGLATRAISIAVMTASLALIPISSAFADSKATIDANTEKALELLRDIDKRAAKVLHKASGVLIFPDVVEMGFGIGGDFGEGALIVDGEVVDYYATAGKLFGMDADEQFKAEVIVFKTDAALKDFRRRNSMRVGDHLRVATAESGIAAERSRAPQVGFVFSQKRLHADLVLDGDRITLITRE